ncbi:transposase [Streptomyces sp. NPDC059814]|uniref:transposase n=1 Tax=unclassified Streptomyces TaxID=2593676 RepID=UPI00365BAFDD
MAKYLKRTEGISVSWHYIARIWREEHLKPHRNGTFKISKAPTFAEKVADVISLYLAPPGGAVVLSIDEKTQIQATSEKAHRRLRPARHHEPVRRPERDRRRSDRRVQADPERQGLPGLLEEGVRPHAEKDIHVVLDNLSTHTTPEVKEWLANNPHVHFHFTSVGSSWLNLIEIWFGILTRQSIGRGNLLQRQRPDQAGPRLHQLLEREREPVHLDRDRWRGPREGQTRRDQREETRQ